MPGLNLQLLQKKKLLAPAAFAVAGLVALIVAWGAALLIERVSASAVTSRLLTDGITFAQVQSDGLQVHLIGTAPNEAARYRAVNLVGSIVDSSRIRDKLEVTPAKAVAAPRFSVEMLRNDDGIQMIGLLPEGVTEAQLTESAQALTPDIPLLDMIETAAYVAPEGWDAALAYGIEALKLLPRSKISVAVDGVAITAIASSDAEKRSFESQLNQSKPAGLNVEIDISAPRPVLTPFTLRFVKDAESARFDACAADTEAARLRILAAAKAAGAGGRMTCTLGLGVPSPSWGAATASGITAVAALSHATITFKDADVSLVASADVAQADFDRVVGDLGAALPEVFSLNAVLEKKATSSVQGPAEFTATLAPETGRVEMRGRLTDDLLRAAVDSFARAEFGTANTYLATRLDPQLPDGWPVRVLAGLEALGQLHHGTLLVRADVVEIKGVTGSQSGKSRIAQILSDKLGQGKTFKVDVSYDKELDPLAALPSAEECAQDVTDVLARQKISFTPGSAEIDASAGSVMAALAKALKDCTAIRMEIAGHTDSQGSEEGNRALSQARAEAVMLALQGRQVDVSGMVAEGYGETVPIADNDSDAGREANRRIEFTLIGGAKDLAGPSLGVQDGVISDQTNAGVVAPRNENSTVQDKAQGAAVPDFSTDTSPSVAPKDKTVLPKTRPDPNG